MHRAESPFVSRAATRRSETLDGTDLPRRRRARRGAKLDGAPLDLDRLTPGCHVLAAVVVLSFTTLFERPAVEVPPEGDIDGAGQVAAELGQRPASERAVTGPARIGAVMRSAGHVVMRVLAFTSRSVSDRHVEGRPLPVVTPASSVQKFSQSTLDFKRLRSVWLSP